MGNQPVCAMVDKLQTRSTRCLPWLKELGWILATWDILLSVEWIDTKANLVADTLSRFYAPNHDQHTCAGAMILSHAGMTPSTQQTQSGNPGQHSRRPDPSYTHTYQWHNSTTIWAAWKQWSTSYEPRRYWVMCHRRQTSQCVPPYGRTKTAHSTRVLRLAWVAIGMTDASVRAACYSIGDGSQKLTQIIILVLSLPNQVVMNYLPFTGNRSGRITHARWQPLRAARRVHWF
eukprot:COSAG01_NODE_6946_length_3428_cov_14.923701_2_plen_231_part_01